jgi:peroxiredoxin Q/BCP
MERRNHMHQHPIRLLLASVIGTFCLVPGRVHAAEGKLMIGKPLPDFTLQGTDGKTYKLADFKGKKAFVMAWYPKAHTGG